MQYVADYNQFQIIIIFKPLVWHLIDLFQWQLILLFTSLQKHDGFVGRLKAIIRTRDGQFEQI